jgi:hypothetical protein
MDDRCSKRRLAPLMQLIQIDLVKFHAAQEWLQGQQAGLAVQTVRGLRP